MTPERDDRADALQPDPLSEDLLQGEHVLPSAALRAAVLRSAVPGLRLDGFAARFIALFDLDPARAQEILRAAHAPESAPWVAPGAPEIRLLHFDGGPRVATADCGLVWLAAGTRFPRHSHRGDEWSLILSGSEEEEGSGERWEPGDLVVRRAGSIHAFRAIGPEPLLFAVVLEGGIDLVGDPT